MGLVEPASALTDFVLGIIAIGAALGIQERGRACFLWRLAFTFMGIAALMGGVHHGFLAPHEAIAKASWAAVTVVIAISLSFVLAATVTIVLGEGKGRTLLAIRTASLIATLIVAVLGYATILTLMITESLVMVMVLVLWVQAWRLRYPGVGMILLAIGASILAAVVKGSSLRTEFFGWDFDANALYHLAQMPGVVLLYLALRRQAQTLESREMVRQPSLSAAARS